MWLFFRYAWSMLRVNLVIHPTGEKSLYCLYCTDCLNQPLACPACPEESGIKSGVGYNSTIKSEHLKGQDVGFLTQLDESRFFRNADLRPLWKMDPRLREDDKRDGMTQKTGWQTFAGNNIKSVVLKSKINGEAQYPATAPHRRRSEAPLKRPFSPIWIICRSEYFERSLIMCPREIRSWITLISNSPISR